MNTVHVVHYTGATAKSLSVLASLALDYQDGGANVTVVDLAKTTTIHQGLPSQWVARLLGHRVMRPSVTEVLRESGVVYLTLANNREPGPIGDSDLKAMEQALESELLTYFRRDHVPSTAESRRLQNSLRKGMHDVYRALETLWLREPPNLVAIPNGRTSRQKAARLVAEKLGIDVWLYENGRAMPNAYYLGKTQPHDRIGSQAEILAGFPLPSTSVLEKQAAEWLANRQAKGSDTNFFSKKWVSLKEPSKEKKSRVAVFFASSFDEFLAFGPMWRIDKWKHQFEAFGLIMSKLEAQGFELVLRLHPNLSSKSREYFKQEVRTISTLAKNHQGLQIHWHNETTNSYELLNKASLVIVERSTIGLEASLMGKPVIACQATQWDQIVDVRQVLKPEDVTLDTLLPWKPSPLGARKFVAYWLAQEHPLRFGWAHWSTWNPDKAPVMMKLAQLTLPNPLSHKKRLLSLEFSRWRNSRFKPARPHNG